MSNAKYRAVLAAWCAALALAAAPRAMAGTWSYVELAPEGGRVETYGLSLNNANEVVVAATDIYVWKSGKFTRLNGLRGEGVYQFGAAINDAGLIAGYDFNNPATPHEGFLYDSVKQKLAALQVPGHDTYPYSISDTGQVVGEFDTFISDRDVRSDAFTYKSGSFTTLHPPGANGSYATFVTGKGQIVGSFTRATDTIGHAFSYAGGRYQTIDVVGYDTYPTWANDLGQIVGSFATHDGDHVHGFIRAGSVFKQIDYPGAAVTEPIAINDRGEVVGVYSITPASQSHIFFYANGRFRSVDPPGTFLASPVAINADGSFAGTYRDRMGYGHGFIATCVPAGSHCDP